MRSFIESFLRGSGPDVALGLVALAIAWVMVPMLLTTLLLIVVGCVTIVVLLVVAMMLGHKLINLFQWLQENT
ncbi:MAG: hypothetical protein RBS78_00825 [Coriobacteriia bacterium]|jgi:hypothetical protein|nr:hypothetical protein [Coriobacteriia bacterium]